MLGSMGNVWEYQKEMNPMSIIVPDVLRKILVLLIKFIQVEVKYEVFRGCIKFYKGLSPERKLREYKLA